MTPGLLPITESKLWDIRLYAVYTQTRQPLKNRRFDLVVAPEPHYSLGKMLILLRFSA